MARPDFTELHLALDWGVASLRYSRAVTNASGIDGSRGTGYLELGVELALADSVSLSLHGGRLSAAGRNALTRAMATDNDALYSYEDASAGLEWKPRGSWRLSIALTTSSARDAGYLLRGRNLGDRHVVAGIAWEG